MWRKIFGTSIFAKILMLVFVMVFFTQMVTLARSGCCSHHGGVCGCGCCDGSSLSATCAPYYSCTTPKPTPRPTYVAPKPIIKTYTVTQYNNILSEKNNLIAEKNTITKEKEDLKKELATTRDATSKIKSEKENLTQELENVKKKLAETEEERDKNKKEISYLKEISPKETGILNALDQTQTAIIKSEKQEANENDTSSNGGFSSFLLGSGLVYGIGRLKRRQEMKKEGVQIKGNITKDGQKIYYTINSRYYDMVKIDKKKGEKWFISEEEAINEGWHKA